MNQTNLDYKETGIPENLEFSGSHDYLDDNFAQSEMTPGVKQGGFRFSGVGPSEYQYQDDESVMLTEQIYNLNK